ncbi:MAG TPA: hypothetical protein VKR61_08795 [Bryobacteraceae bacterium]|nr:hypothetical protein [Bryobacteraceae bacterium]
MMQRKKVIQAAALVGAIVGALFVRIDIPVNQIPFLTPDRALLDHRAFLAASVVGWVLFSLYWEIAAQGAAAARSSESKAPRAVHVALVNLALVIEIAPIRGLGLLTMYLGVALITGERLAPRRGILCLLAQDPPRRSPSEFSVRPGV